jgi:DNA modification methylase
MNSQFHFGNCQDVLQQYPDGYFQLLLVDSPYENTDLPFDKQPVDWAALWPEITRVLAPTGVVVCFAAESFTLDLIASNRAWYCYRRVWVKSKASRYLDKAWRPLAGHEDLVVFSPAIRSSTYNPQKTLSTGPRKHTKRKATKQSHYKSQRYAAEYVDDGTRYPTTVLYYPSVGATAPHYNATAKPLGLVQELVETYSNRSDNVGELFGGDCPTAHACRNTERNCVSIENNRRQFDWSLNHYTQTAPLFAQALTEGRLAA